MHAIRTLVALASVATLGSALLACSSSDTTGSGGSGGSASTSTATATSTATGAGGGTSTSTGAGGGAPAEATFIAHFDPMKGELPEGLFVTGTKAYVGYAALGKVVTVDLTTGKVTDFGSIPAIPMNAGFMLGIAVDDAGNVFVGFGGGPGMPVKNGVYKIPAAGGAVTDPWASDPAMNFPNGLIFDDKKTLTVADSGGTIFKIASDGTVTKWLADATLGSAGPTCMFAAPFPLGANGIVESGGAFYLSNTNLAQMVKVPINADGSAGKPAVFSGPDCNGLGGVDGIALDTDGSILAVINSQNELVRVGTDGKVSTVLKGAPLDNPASLSVAMVGGKKLALFTNSAFFDTKAPAPGLLSVPLP